jgi:hypothetical protein
MRSENLVAKTDREIRRQYCKVCGGELRGKVVHEENWSYHLSCWKKDEGGAFPLKATYEEDLKGQNGSGRWRIRRI